MIVLTKREKRPQRKRVTSNNANSLTIVRLSLISAACPRCRKKDVRRGHTKLCCELCQRQGRTARDQESLQLCAHADPSKICQQYGRYQAKKRFAAGKVECLLCCGSHTPCKKCYKLVNIQKEIRQTQWNCKHGLSHTVCDKCEAAGHTAHDVGTYECREGGCVTTGGISMFDATSVMNFKARQEIKPICLKCTKKIRRQRT